MQRDTAHLSELTHLIYNAALHPEQWNNAVAAIAASFNCTQGLLLTPYLGPQHGGVYFPLRIDEAYVQLYATHYIDKNVWNQGMEKRGLWLDGNVCTGDEILPRDEFLASPFYREFLKPQGTAQTCMGIVFAGSADFPATLLNIFRDLHEPEFNEQDKAWMRLLITHVSRSMGLMLRLETARVQNAALLASFDRLNCGVALLNQEMQVLHLNQAAQGVVQRGDGLSLNAQRRLEGCTANTGNPLLSVSSWLESVRSMPLSEQPHFLQGAVVARANNHGGNDLDHNRRGNKRYDLQCVHLPKTDAWLAQQQDARYVVFITDPKVVNLPDNERLSALYGLTVTQAKATREFARGASYKEVARRLKISEDTVRSHIKEIYRKTRVNRQADLMHLILSISQSGV